MHIFLYLISIATFSSKPGKSEEVFSNEPQTEIEYQPIGEVQPNESNASSVLEVSSQPLPLEPEHPQVVTPEHLQVVTPEQVTKIDPSQNILPTPVSYQLPPVQPVGSRPTGHETEPLPPPLVEPEPPAVQPAPVSALVTTTSAGASATSTHQPAPVLVPQLGLQPAPVPQPAPQPAPVPAPAPPPQPVAQCPIPECSYPSVCIQAEVYATCVAPNSSTSANNTCSTSGPCLTTLTKTATDTTTLMLTQTQTETSTAVATLTNTETTTKTNTALTTQTHTQTDVMTSTSTLTTTNTEVATSTHHTTKTSTAVLTSHVPITTTTTLTTTSIGVVNTTNTHTLTSTAILKTTETSTAVVTSIANKTNTHTLTTTNTDTVTSTQLATSTTILTTTSTGIATSTLLTTATKTNTVNGTKFATETLTKTLTTTTTDTLTQTQNATNVITATTTSTAIDTSTATLTATSTAKTTETLTATSTAVLTQTLTNTHNQTITQTKTLTATSTSVVTTCSANCTKIEPTPSRSPSTSIVPSTVTPTPSPPPGQQGCAVNYTKLGCFKDDRKKPRPLPELLFTDRDSRSKVSSGQTIDWNNWNKYMVDLVCRCAKAAKDKKYTFFSLQYFGECWSGSEAGETYNRAGTSDKCVTKNYTKCNPSDNQECVGDQNVNFVYGIDVKEPVVTPTQPTLPPTQPPSPTPDITPSCNEALDIGVIIDSSDSITLGDYNLCLQFVADLVKHFKVSQEGTHFGAIVFSSTPELQFSFADKQFYKSKRLRKKIKSFPYLAEGTRTDLALSLANMELFSEQGGDRVGKSDVLVVITDGKTNPQLSHPYSEVLQPLQAKNVRVLAVGVGKNVDQKELKTIAMNDEKHVFRVTKYKDLVKILDALLKESCHQVSPTAPPPSISGTLPPTPAASLQKCNIEYQKLGCFVDKELNNPTAALSEMILEETNDIDWDKWSAWLPDFVCRCANLVHEKNYNVFGVHMYGECLSGIKAGDTYSMYGASEQCIDTHQQQCGVSSVGECAGDQNSSYVYRIIISQGAEIEPSPVPTTTEPEVKLVTGEVTEDCPVDFSKKGCFNDLKNGSRPLPQLMFTDLNNTAAQYSGFPVDWGSWDAYLDGVVCRCAQASNEKGFNVFGIENFGECWSGEDFEKTYSKDGSSEYCITKEFAQCDTNGGKVCSGNKTTTFIYSIQENHKSQRAESCFTQFENVGCFADKNISSRPIPELIFTDMNSSSPKFSGKDAQLGELDTYLGDVLCRCAEQAQELGYQYFGVQNHGECYSGPIAGQTYSKDGSSKQCITTDFQQCPVEKPGSKDARQNCVGIKDSNYVYRISKSESKKDAVQNRS